MLHVGARSVNETVLADIHHEACCGIDRRVLSCSEQEIERSVLTILLDSKQVCQNANLPPLTPNPMVMSMWAAEQVDALAHTAPPLSTTVGNHKFRRSVTTLDCDISAIIINL